MKMLSLVKHLPSALPVISPVVKESQADPGFMLWKKKTLAISLKEELLHHSLWLIAINIVWSIASFLPFSPSPTLTYIIAHLVRLRSKQGCEVHIILRVLYRLLIESDLKKKIGLQILNEIIHSPNPLILTTKFNQNGSIKIVLYQMGFTVVLLFFPSQTSHAR